jgi:H+-transporting ATPase
VVAALGFGGYAPPPGAVNDCALCLDSNFEPVKFWASGKVPVAGTESAFVASVIGCTYWVVVAWIW